MSLPHPPIQPVLRAERDQEIERLLASLRSQSVFAPNQPAGDVKAVFNDL